MIRRLPLLLLVACAHRPSAPDPLKAPRAAAHAPIPVDPAVRVGRLDNGLRYYLQHNENPDNRVVLRLALDVGSVVEDDDQLGVAHLVEHMAFNGTTHFPGNGVIAALERFGAQFGPHINAHTSFDETVYKLSIPTDDPAALDAGFQILADWAGGMTLDPVEVEKERGVVLEEWRRAQGAGWRVQQQVIAAELGAQYAGRLPIGTEASLRTVTPEAVRRFVADWYRPERMSVVVVGDLDLDDAEARVRGGFAGLARQPDARPRLRGDIPAVPGQRIVVASDPEWTQSRVSLGRTFDDVERTDHGGARENAAAALLNRLFQDRMAERARAADRPFQGAWMSEQRVTPDEAAREIGVSTRDGDALRGLEVLLEEWRRIGLHGFNPGELARARAAELAAWDERLRQQGDVESVDEAGELVRVALNGEYYTSLPYEHALMTHLLREVSLAEVGELARGWLEGDSRLVEVIVPQTPAHPVPTEAEVAAVVARALASTPEALPDTAADGPLAPPPERPGAIVATERLDPGLGFVKWTLSNGVVVYHRRSTLEPGQISLQAFSPGGLSMADDADFHAAAAATALAAESGAGPYDAVTLGRRLAGKQVSAGVWVGAREEGARGSAATQDLETWMQLLWLRLTAPRSDADAFARWRGDAADQLAHRALDPETAFWDAQTRTLWGDDLRLRRWEPADLDRITPSAADAFLRGRLADVTDWTFVFVGDVDEAVLGDAVARWLGALPAAGRVEAAVDRGARRLPGPASVTVRAGEEPKAHVRLLWHGPFVDDYAHRNRAMAMTDILGVLLREELREARSGVYGVSASFQSEDAPVPAYEVVVDFVCDPARVPELQAAALAVVEGLRATPVDPQRVADEQAKNRREREEQRQTDGFWLGGLVTALRGGEDPREILTWDARNDSLTPAVIQETAAALLGPDNRKEVVRLPAASAP